MVDANCNIIVTVGFLLSDDTLPRPRRTPTSSSPSWTTTTQDLPGGQEPEAAGVQHRRSSFLAGYLAAGMTKTKKVGTFGGVNIPTVTIFMDGFAQGVDHYNKTKGGSVQVLGWDAAKQDGSSLATIEDTKGGQRTAEGLISQGATSSSRWPARPASAPSRRSRAAAARPMPSGWTPTAA
jgi:basic membrane protein A